MAAFPLVVLLWFLPKYGCSCTCGIKYEKSTTAFLRRKCESSGPQDPFFVVLCREFVEYGLLLSV